MSFSFRDAAGTTIDFALRAEGDDTVLVFAQRGFAEANEAYALVTTGWAYYLVSLQQYLETGKGAPHPEKDFARVFRRGGARERPAGSVVDRCKSNQISCPLNSL